MPKLKEQFSLFDAPENATEEERKSGVRPSGDQSNFIVYVDESGDHGMQTVDPNYPIFVLPSVYFIKAITARRSFRRSRSSNSIGLATIS